MMDLKVGLQLLLGIGAVVEVALGAYYHHKKDYEKSTNCASWSVVFYLGYMS